MAAMLLHSDKVRLCLVKKCFPNGRSRSLEVDRKSSGIPCHTQHDLVLCAFTAHDETPQSCKGLKVPSRISTQHPADRLGNIIAPKGCCVWRSEVIRWNLQRRQLTAMKRRAPEPCVFIVSRSVLLPGWGAVYGRSLCLSANWGVSSSIGGALAHE